MKPFLLIITFCLSLLLVATGVSHAQTATEEKEDQKQQAQTARSLAQTASGLNAPVTDSTPTFMLDSSQDGTFMTGRLGLETNREVTNFQLGLQLRTPFDPNNSDKEVGFLNLDGLTGGTSATLSFSIQGDLRPIGTGPTLRSLCNEANKELRERFFNLDPDANQVRACTPEEIVNDSLLDNEVEQAQTKALWSMCQDVNKTRGIGLLAPPGATLRDFPGHSAICSERALGGLRLEAVRANLRDRARARVVEEVIARTPAGQSIQVPEGRVLENAIQRILPSILSEACGEFNKNRARNRLFDPASPPVVRDELWFGECSLENLARAAVREELETKQQAATQAACQKRLAVPSEALFITGRTPLHNCFLTTLLEFAETTSRPSKFQRKILKAIPITHWYITLKGTQVDQTFKFLNQDDNFKEASPIDSDSTSLGLSASLYTRGWLFTVGADRQKRFKSAPVSEICVPIPDTEGLSCQQAALRGPDRKDMNLVRAEVKTLWGPGGTTLRTIHDNDDNEWEHHLIFHFLRNPKEGLNGGIDLQYNTNAVAAGASDAKGAHVTARLFVGVKFGLPFLPGNPPTQAP